jgi:hypothetical protein
METIAQRRSLLVGAVSLIRRLRLKDDGVAAIAARDELRAAIDANGYLVGAPFKTVAVMFRYGESENLEPDRYEINEDRGCLNLGIQFNGHELAQLTHEQLREKFRTTLIEVLCDVAANFDLPFEFLDEMRHET